ncbi:hypothetical protein L204_103689 [Cryptococcus depauperatus]|nr:protein kinase C substrate 80K-H [Cryptococcus depauperatus CBS 7855]
MKDSTTLALLSFILLLTLGAAAEHKKNIIVPSQIQGLNPLLYEKYEPTSSGLFHCLDGSKTIPFAAINDDYCDCPDGSDEPGTSACQDGLFWCKNEGHIPDQIVKSRVGDGLCEPECCDGSDEWQTGACPNRCEQIGKQWRAEKEAQEKIRRTGAKVRSSYIKWAEGEKKRLKIELAQKTEEIAFKEAEVAKAKVALEETEAQNHKDLEYRKQSPVYQSLLDHRSALERLRTKSVRLQSELDTLHSLLRELAKGYNPNYQDMAVKAAVVGYEELTGIRYREGENEGNKREEKEVIQEIEDKELEELEKKDLEALLLSDTINVGLVVDEDDDETSLLWKFDEYIPDSLYDSWENVRDLAIEWMVRFGLAGKPKKKSSGPDGPQVAAAREKHRVLENELIKLQNTVRSTEDTLSKMNKHYGSQNEWKKLDGSCIESVIGDYTYELCFFGKVRQKSNKDGSSNDLGTFNSWNPVASEGTLPYYSQQIYKDGAKCWNGPHRSATVDISCGISNALLAVSEPEKCEYHFKVTSPAVCWTENEGVVDDEVKSEIKDEL